MDVKEQARSHFNEAIEHLKKELGSLRTGVAHVGLVEHVLVNYYGVNTPLDQLASIIVQDPKTIVIQPWDRNAIKEMEKAIASSDIGLNPINEGNLLRIIVPPLTEERRRELIKILHEKIERARVSIRNTREELWKKMKDDQQSGRMSEDELFRTQKELQKHVDEYNETIKEMGAKKEQELLTV